MDRINILQILAGENVGGGEIYLLLLADRLDRNRYRILFASSREKDFLSQLCKRNLEVLLVNMDSKFNPKTFLRLRNFILDKKIKIVHTHGARASFYGRVAARWAGVPIISTVHNSLYDYPITKIRRRIYVFIDKLTSRLCDKIICVSKAIASDLILKAKINPQKVLTIHNGIDIERFRQIEDCSYLLKEFNIGPQDKKIGIVGRLTQLKGHIYLLMAIAKLVNTFPDIKCFIVGDGRLKQKLIKLVHKLGISANCIFTGNRQDIAQILSFLDILVLSSVSEGFPMVLLEAMAAGCPIVATKVGGVPELIEQGVNGILVPPKDSSYLAEAISALLKDKDKAQRISSSARKLVEDKFNAGIMVHNIEELYAKLIKENL